MGLSSDLIAQFVKVTKDTSKTKKEFSTYGKIVKEDGQPLRVILDGATIKTPVLEPVEVEVEDGDRVAVTIKNNSVVVTGNLDSPAVGSGNVEQRVNNLVADNATIKTLVSDNVTVKETLFADDGIFNLLHADDGVINSLKTNSADIKTLKTDALMSETAKLTYVAIGKTDVGEAYIHYVKGTYSDFVVATVDQLTSVDAKLKNLNSEYANIDFANIGKAAMEHLYSASGLIENVTISDGTITGLLVGVTIKGDIIEGNTIVADKLVIQGEDGLYYKLNVDGVTSDMDVEQTDYNSLNGRIITAKSITAEQISVDDLVAFDATIGGFTITDNAIYSNVKDSDGNTTRGTYIGADGEVNFGDANRFIKYYVDSDGTWRLAIAADTILYDVNGEPHSLADLGAIGEYVTIGTYEGEPCIELGETDSDFKLLITNTRMLFMEGTEVVAHISNQSLHIKKAVIEEELQQGDFVWKVRANGNIGLMWKGDT